MYLLAKLSYSISLLIAIIVVTFTLFHAVPSDPARTILGPHAAEEQLASFRSAQGLDKPILVQLWSYIYNVFTLEFGRSYITDLPVLQDVLKKWKVSLALVMLSTAIIGSYLFMVAFSGKKYFKVFNLVGLAFASSPTYFSGILLALAVYSWYPFTFLTGQLPHDMLTMLPPAFVLALYPMAVLSKILRHEINELDSAPFITAARAFGCDEFTIRTHHVLRNACLPVLSAFSSQLPMLFTGAFIVELIFSLPGLGSLLVDAILQRDFVVLEAIVITNGIVFIVVNFIFEIIYPVIDPRILSNNAS